MVASNIKIARTTLNVPKPLMQTPTNNVVKVNTLPEVRIIDSTEKMAHQGVPHTIRPELRKNAVTAIKNLVPTTLQEAMGIATMGH
jgi:hypothetical protein